jgi:hypothetical protein
MDRSSNQLFKIDYSKIPVVNLPKSREVFIKIHNLKEFSVDRLSVGFAAPLAETNVNMNGTWQQPIFQFSDSNGRDWYGWAIEENHPMGGFGGFNATTFSISTNVQNATVPVRIEVDAIGARHQDFFMLLKL